MFLFFAFFIYFFNKKCYVYNSIKLKIYTMKRKLTRKELKNTTGSGPLKPETGIETGDPTGVACGGSHCPDDSYRCCYHRAGNYCSTSTCM